MSNERASAIATLCEYVERPVRVEIDDGACRPTVVFLTVEMARQLLRTLESAIQYDEEKNRQ